MPEFGISVINSTGQTQIDGTYRNLQLDVQGSSSVVKPYSMVGTGLSYTGVEIPLIAMRADPTYYHCFLGIFNDESNWAFGVRSSGNHTMYYTGWNRPTSFGGENYGIEVTNADGDIVFDATMDWMRIASVNTGSLTVGNSANHTVIDATNNYFVLTNLCWALTGAGYHNRGFKKANSTTVTVNTFKYADIIPDDSQSSDWENSYALIEIENP